MVMMTMSFLLHDHFDTCESYSPAAGVGDVPLRSGERDQIHILAEKLEIPRFERHVARPRLGEMLERSFTQYAATLISGRAGTGKTALGAELANKRKHVAWYSIESSDVDWNVFARYFATSVLSAAKMEIDVTKFLRETPDTSCGSATVFLSRLLSAAESNLRSDRLLIALDRTHNLFEAPWFADFFHALMALLPETFDLLVLCRSKPPGPTWRLRSKQQLNVIDEKVLAFNTEETAALLKLYGRRRWDAERTRFDCYGRIAKLLQCIERG